MGDLLLASGGLDSSALAAWQAPQAALVVNYGQRCAIAELRSARRICAELGIPLRTVCLDASDIGRGLLAEDSVVEGSTPEFWPFRNQLLITVAASVAFSDGHSNVMVGTVSSDGARHVDGTAAFVDAISGLCAMQEGAVTVTAPAITLSTPELIAASGASMSMLGWTHSCHTGNVACGNCPGCWKRSNAFEALGHPR